MKKLTKRESALGWNSQAPLDQDRAVPAKRTRDPDKETEWGFQTLCIKQIRERQKLDRGLRFIAAGALSFQLRGKQAMWAKMQGYQAGIPDIILMRFVKSRFGADRKIWCVELKLPGKPLSDAQTQWQQFFEAAEVPFSRVDTLKDFLRILDNF